MFQFLGFVQIKYIQYSFTFFKQRHLLLLYIISHMYIFSSHYIESIFFFLAQLENTQRNRDASKKSTFWFVSSALVLML